MGNRPERRRTGGGGLPGWLALLLLATPAAAQEVPATGSDFGGAGLIEMRNARFRPDGTLEAGAALRNQRQFRFLGFQALPFLETTFRLTDRLNGTTGQGTTNDRAFDLKLQLWQEGPWRPALAVGLQDAIGTGIYGGEYLVASKRFGPSTVSLGMGWGRLGTGADLRNPFGLVSRATRPGRGMSARAAPRPWQPGSMARMWRSSAGSICRAALLGRDRGAPRQVEWSGDALRDERGGYPAKHHRARAGGPGPGSILAWNGSRPLAGCRRAFRPWHRPAAAALAAAGPGAAARRPAPRAAAHPAPPRGRGTPGHLDTALRAAGFHPLGALLAGPEALVAVGDGRFPTLAQVAGRVARIAQPLLPPEVERLAVEWHRAGLPIARLVLLREAMEAAAIGQGSAEEVLASASLVPAEPLSRSPRRR